jgi:hypothetical protein
VVPPHLGGFSPPWLRRLVASCSRPWGSPGFRSVVDLPIERSPSFPTGASPFRAFPLRTAAPASPQAVAPSPLLDCESSATSRPCSTRRSVAHPYRCWQSAPDALLGFPSWSRVQVASHFRPHRGVDGRDPAAPRCRRAEWLTEVALSIQIRWVKPFRTFVDDPRIVSRRAVTSGLRPASSDDALSIRSRAHAADVLQTSLRRA